ncbi:chaperone J-domain-containing protein [Sistotremastrum niveocremeum HHB9708]|uniref:Chaperone J-domain-containing protein n=1 Tax=Sistotremastrum niveocremeum HHB9708 TaxID=1314777 RepID=A0A164ZU90_9AGAM|nr:chaperone J-domain-containing protein [Sistotremastrum niveocremeum HHB9708]
MKLFYILFLLSALWSSVIAWDKNDYEIFDLVSDLEGAEGKGTTFYSWLDVPSTATSAEISKAYRKKSVAMHPDKNPNVKGIHERFARLGVIAQILRNKEGRERYDFFYKNGVPKWRGTGYYYSRFRPGLGSVFTFLVLLTSGLQYVVQKMNYSRDLERIDRFVRLARTAAWGPKLIPVSGARKVKIPVGGGGQLDEDGNPTQGGRLLELVVDGEEVFIIEPDGSWLPLDSSAANTPAISSTWFIALIRSVVSRVRDRVASGAGASKGESGGSSEQESDESLESIDDSASEITSEGVKGRQAAVKAGGRRRKAVPKKR